MNEMKERENYEWRVRPRVKNFKHQRDEINGKIFQRNLDIILNHDPSKKNLYLKEMDEMEKESDYLNSYIDALEKKIELEFQPLPKSKSKAKAKAKPKPKPVVNENPTSITLPADGDYEIDNGLLGVKRDLFNKLGTHRWSDDHDLRQMYGISSGQMPWIKHFTFELKRARKPNPKPKPKSILQAYGNKNIF
jgi:hypothetical protein